VNIDVGDRVRYTSPDGGWTATGIVYRIDDEGYAYVATGHAVETSWHVSRLERA
jgi:hypothetical protein